jgi:CDP-ribitol ribitolphosphotransferase / teichoic acid ribitol-phosphate polymerase
MRIVLFGTGQCARSFSASLDPGVDVVCACDNNPAVWGTQFEGVRVLSPAELGAVRYDYIVVCSVRSEEITAGLVGRGIPAEAIVSFYDAGTARARELDVLQAMTKRPDDDGIALVATGRSGSNCHALAVHAPDEIRRTRPVSVVPSTVFARGPARHGAVFTTHLEGLWCGRGAVNVELWHGFPLKALAAAHRTAEYGTTRLGDRLAGITSYSPLYSYVMSSVFRIDISKFTVTGAPRNDFLAGSRATEVQRLLFGPENLSRQLVVYAPTFRAATHRAGRDGENVFTCRQDFERLDRFCASRNLLFVVKAHPLEGDRPGARDYEHIRFLYDDELESVDADFYELLGGAACLVTDYSSVAFDFLLTRRPIVYWTKDRGAYADARGFMFDHPESFMPGPVATDGATLVAHVDRALADGTWHQDERERVKRLVHTYDDFRSSERVWERFVNLWDASPRGVAVAG